MVHLASSFARRSSGRRASAAPPLRCAAAVAACNGRAAIAWAPPRPELGARALRGWWLGSESERAERGPTSGSRGSCNCRSLRRSVSSRLRNSTCICRFCRSSSRTSSPRAWSAFEATSTDSDLNSCTPLAASLLPSSRHSPLSAMLAACCHRGTSCEEIWWSSEATGAAAVVAVAETAASAPNPNSCVPLPADLPKSPCQAAAEITATAATSAPNPSSRKPPTAYLLPCSLSLSIAPAPERGGLEASRPSNTSSQRGGSGHSSSGATRPRDEAPPRALLGR
mmetsp:Transcript_28186/g.93600  ORF Transcript_28186/g.93600 Transcript_28186/m.93600 type:complete len:282 (+) Transcript_28186:1811-2656(+)